MTDLNDLLINTKKEIRSVLLPAQQGLDLQRFLKDYSGLMGRTLPFRELGYHKAEEFLRKITDVVSMQYDFSGGCILHAVADESTKHIQKLVEKQKVTRRKKLTTKYPSRMYSNSYSRPSLRPSYVFETPPRLQRNPPWTSNTIAPRLPGLSHLPSRPLPAAAPSSTSNWSEVARTPRPTAATSTPRPTADTSTPRPTATTSTPRPAVATSTSRPATVTATVRPATSTLTAPSVSVPHFSVSVSTSVLPLSTLNHEVSVLVQEHNDDGVNCGDLEQVFKNKYQRDIDFKKYDFESLEEYLEQVPGLLPKNVNGVLKIFFEGNMKIMSPKPAENGLDTNKLYSWPNVNPKLFDLNHNEPSNLKPKNFLDEVKEATKDYEDNEDRVDPGISEKMKQEFREVLNRYPRGLFSRDFLSCYKVHTSHDLNLKDLGYYSLIDLVDALPDVFKRYQPENCKSDWLLFDSSAVTNQQQILKAINPPKDNTIRARAIYNETISNIRKILQAYPEGIFLDEFLHTYSLNCEIPLTVKQLGFENLENFFLSIEDEVPLKFDYLANLRPKVHLAFTPSPSESFRTHKVITDLEKDIPKDAILPGAKFSAQILPNLSKGKYFPIFTGTIMSPSSIWIQLKASSSALSNVMDRMEELYVSKEGKKYKMLDQHIVAGAIGAGVWDHDGNWYRICIISVDMDSVKAMFVDYGNLGKIRKSYLRYLTKDFTNLPAQAVKARMAFVTPIREEWDTKVRERLLQICKDQEVMAEIIDQPQHGDTVSLWLCCCLEEDDMHLNKLLIDEGYAKFYQEDKTATCLGANLLQNQPSQPDPSMNPVPRPAEVLKAMNTLSRFYGAFPTNAEPNKTLDLFMQNSSMTHQPTANTQISSPYSYASSNPGTLPNYPAPSQGLGHFPYQPQLPLNGNFNQSMLMAYLDSVTTKNPNNSYANVELPNMAPLTIEQNFVKPPMLSSQTSTISGQDDNVSSEIFEDDDDDEFEKICKELGCVQRYVQRVNLKFNYRIHIISLDGIPYVTTGDVSHLLWPTEDSDPLLRRLRQNNIPIRVKTIDFSENPTLFDQLERLNVHGLKKTEDKLCVPLLYLEDVERIMNHFGHPSPSIRLELRSEVNQFDPSSVVWNSFEEPVEEEKEGNLPIETDSQKFLSFCVSDLKGKKEGLKFKQLNLKKMQLRGEDTEVNNNLEKINKQLQMYEKRIKQIEVFSTSNKAECVGKS